MMCCFYPTTTVAIDDDVDFLRMITQHLDIPDCVSYSSPKQAIQLLKKNSSFERIQSRIFKKATHPENMDEHTFSINLHNLHHEIYSDERFKDVSVIVVDYYMDELTGIEVCEALADHPAKKILLTGGSDKEKIAIEAFNKGIIHRFINKTDVNFPTQLKNSIAILKDAYFRDLTSSFFPNFTSESINLLNNPTYINFFKNLQHQFDAVEYYIFDNNGSSVLLDKIGTPTWVVIKQDDELNNLGKIAEDNETDIQLLQTLFDRNQIPFFFTENDYQQQASEWQQFLYTAHPFPGLKKHHYSIIEGHVRNNLSQEKIVPYVRWDLCNAT